MLKHWLVHSVKISYIALAVTAFLIGIIGIVTPVLPTTPFLLVAVWAAARGSPRVYTWLMLQPHISTPVNAWRTEGAIPYSAKRLALFMMLISWVGLLLTGISWETLVGATFLLVLISLFIASRPAPHTELSRSLETIILYQGCQIYKDLRVYSDPESFKE